MPSAAPTAERDRAGGALLVDSREASRMLSISERKLWELKESGEIHSVKIGRAVRFSVADLQDFVERQRS